MRLNSTRVHPPSPRVGTTSRHAMGQPVAMTHSQLAAGGLSKRSKRIEALDSIPISSPPSSTQGGAVPPGVPSGLHRQPAAQSIHRGRHGPPLPGGAVAPTARMFPAADLVQTLVPAGSRWRWFTDAAGLGSSDIVGAAQAVFGELEAPGFDDQRGARGRAQLGYGGR